MTNKELEKKVISLEGKIDKLIELNTFDVPKAIPYTIEKQRGCVDIREEQPKEEFEANNWYILDDKQLVFFTKIEGNDGFGFGFITCGTWIDENDCSWDLKDLVGRKATPQEVEEALIKEAKKRGFKEGVSYHHISQIGTTKSLTSKGTHAPAACFKNNSVYIGFQYIYWDGKWAEIIEDSFEIAGHKVEIGRAIIKVGCSTFSKEGLKSTYVSLVSAGIHSVIHEDGEKVYVQELKELIDYINK